MNEIQELAKLDMGDLPPLIPACLDDLYEKVLGNLYLELGSDPVLYLLSPSYLVLNPVQDEEIVSLIRGKEDLIAYVKEYIVRNLAAYSVLLDVNSYYIEQNDHLVLARLEKNDSGRQYYEIKFYTHSPEELLTHYEDKIYMGRHFINLFQFTKDYFGVKELIVSLADQCDPMLDKAKETLSEPGEYSSFFQEIKESAVELLDESFLIMESVPPLLDFGKLKVEDLIEIKAQYRSIKHYLIELNGEVTEFENLVRFKKEVKPAHYITMYRKDLANLISYINIRIDGYIAQLLFSSVALE
jgi:hypothetical protein